MNDRRSNIILRLDWATVILYLLMIGLGWLNIYAATIQEADSGSILDFSTRYSKQFYYIMTAMIIAWIILVLDSKIWGFFAYPVYGFILLILISVLVFGREINGARSWFVFGPINIQPAEFMKTGVALIVAKVLSRFNFQVQRMKSVLLLALLIGIPMVLIFLQNDTGSALVFGVFVLVLFREGLSANVLILLSAAIVIFLLTMVMPLDYFLPLITLLVLLLTYGYKRNLRYFGLGLVSFGAMFGISWLVKITASLDWNFTSLFFVAASGSFILWMILIFAKRLNPLYLFLFAWFGALILVFSVDFVFNELLEPHQQSRINQVLGLESDPLGSGYNLIQSKIAIGSGGFMGKGFLQGTQTRFNFVPEQSTDFIFCTVGEEWGFIGSFVIIALFTGLLLRLIYLAERQRSVFSRIYGYGVVSILFFHYAVNIGMTIGLVPVIGIPLPFFSYGGSALLGFTLLLFVLLKLDSDRYEVVA